MRKFNTFARVGRQLSLWQRGQRVEINRWRGIRNERVVMGDMGVTVRYTLYVIKIKSIPAQEHSFIQVSIYV